MSEKRRASKKAAPKQKYESVFMGLNVNSYGVDECDFISSASVKEKTYDGEWDRIVEIRIPLPPADTPAQRTVLTLPVTK